MEIIKNMRRMFMNNLSKRESNIKGYLLERLSLLKRIETNCSLSPLDKVKYMAKINIITHLIDYDGYRHFLDKEEVDKYIEQSANIICGFYEE
jgi:hypothetical protein